MAQFNGQDFTNTQGNNVHAYRDFDGNDAPDFTVDGGTALNFNFPQNTVNAEVTNVFYWVNLCHEIFYQYGFDEAAGNFQGRKLYKLRCWR